MLYNLLWMGLSSLVFLELFSEDKHMQVTSSYSVSKSLQPPEPAPNDSPWNLAQEILGKTATITHIAQLEGGHSNHIWRVETSQSTYILRRLKDTAARQKFDKQLAIALKASEQGVGPRIYGWHEDQCATLMEYIENSPLPDIEKNPDPYFTAMDQLRRFHQLVSRESQPESEVDPIHSIQRAVENLTSPVPPQLKEQVLRVSQLFEELLPWLKANAVVLHGDFKCGNVLHNLSGDKWSVYLIDFDTTCPGHPFFDIAKYILGFSEPQKSAMLSRYLNKSAPSDRDRLHFSICHATLVLLVATNAFSHADKHLKSEAGDKSLSSHEMQNLLQDQVGPTFMEVPFDASTAQMCQRRGILALKEVIATTEKIKSLPTG